MRMRGKNHIPGGFTLVEAMVTVAVVAILAAVAVPGLRGFVTRSGMNGVRDDFAITLQRARLDAINRNTCVTVCQLAANSQDTCETQANLGQWHRGWLVYANDACTSPTATPVPAGSLISVRQPGNPRFQLRDGSTAPDAGLTFNPRGLLRAGGNTTFSVVDADDADRNPFGREIAVSFQGRVSVQPITPKAPGGDATSVAGANP